MRNYKPLLLASFLIAFLLNPLFAEDGYELWLRYPRIQNSQLSNQYAKAFSSLHLPSADGTLSLVQRELTTGMKGLLGKEVPLSGELRDGSIVAVKLSGLRRLNLQEPDPGKDGFIIKTTRINGKRCTLITSSSEVGVLYGAFHFLRLMQQHVLPSDFNVKSSPRINNRILNHWDNLDRTVERGYAGFSLWDWHKLPDYIDQRYHDYARANASIGINGTVLTNVNANALVLTDTYLQKVKALADVFRPYGIRVYLTARFSSPMEIGGLRTADPLDPQVVQWWKDKCASIYKLIPDFGGFLVKANSEGQPGPQNYGRSHADGANVLADALQPFGGIVMWRAFVYSHEIHEDRVKQAYNEFKPLDGKFASNVLLQVKNGPLDFQPREPFHPLFGAMKSTPLMMEFQITQEYLGFATHLVYLGKMFAETLRNDTWQNGEGSFVSKVVDGSMVRNNVTAIAGVANIGNDRNWTGHPFAQANWYAFGRMAWDLDIDQEALVKEWIQQTFSTEADVVATISRLMLNSHEITVNYMTPIGLHHIMGWDHHYGPAPWISNKPRADWTSVYYHKANRDSIGFNRTSSGSNALQQYHKSVQSIYFNPQHCPAEYLLWFHRLPWEFKMSSGRTLWQELCQRYYHGAEQVNSMRETWTALQGKIDAERFDHVRTLLSIQYKEACWWRDACLLYFESVSGRKIPEAYTRPEKPLEFYLSLEFPYAPGIRPKW